MENLLIVIGCGGCIGLGFYLQIPLEAGTRYENVF